MRYKIDSYVIIVCWAGTNGAGKISINLKVSQLESSIKKNNTKVRILLDYFRATRSSPKDSCHLFLPIVKQHSDAFRLSLFHNPKPSRIPQFLPHKFREILGVMHLKAYVFDDNVLLSGANLNHDYFVNRQDRYYFIQNNRIVADYFRDLMDSVSLLSFTVECENGEIVYEEPSMGVNPFRNPIAFRQVAKESLSNFTQRWNGKEFPDSYNTYLFPGIQLGAIGIRQESNMMISLLDCLAENDNTNWSIFVVSGYFNLVQAYEKRLIGMKNSACRFLLASPHANGFLTAKGPSKYIPHIYSELEKRLLLRIEENGISERCELYEFKRDAWTFHAKGIWVGSEANLAMTVIGSSNLNSRSDKLDLECQAFIVTTDDSLQSIMKEVYAHLMS